MFSFFKSLQLSKKLNWWGGFVVLNTCLAALIGMRYLSWVQVDSGITALYVLLLYIGQFFFLSLLVGFVFLLAIVLPKKGYLLLCSLISTTALSILVIDTFVYDQFRFHISSFVIELLLGAGGDVFSFSWITWVAVVGSALVAFFLQYFFANILWHKAPKARYVFLCFILCFFSLVFVHAWHAWADANHNNYITAASPHMPLYYGLTAKRYIYKQGWVDHQALRENESKLKLHAQSSGVLNYPQSPLECSDPKSKMNILLITVDSLRADMLNPKWMPHTYNFSKSALNFTNHFSNGNATKPGVFTLFYSIPASYWDAFTSSQTAPVWISRMQKLKYNTKILAAATLLSPAFGQNVFSSIKNLRMDTPGNSPWEKDLNITQDWLNFTNEYKNTDQAQPFFGFLFYDTPHSIYLPKDYPKFQPYWENVNYLELNNSFDPEPYFNLYKSTAHYADHLIKKVLDDLKDKDLLKNTIVMITSDHGKEFNDNKKNYWGHGSNFSDAQLKVPMIVHWPGKAPSEITYRTSHFDVAPSFLSEVLGCKATATKSYASGNGLFKPSTKDWSIVHSYVHYALIYKDLLVVRSPVGPVQVTDKNLNPIDEYNIPTDVVLDVLGELSRFFK